MKYMRLGTRPDTFYTGEATRMINSDLPSDLRIRINNITYLLHKFPLLQKSGLLQQRCSERGEIGGFTVDLHDIPGGADAFELCAKFCYGIKIDLSAHNIVPAICAAKFLLMTESVREGNFVSKLEVFFDSCILEGWKDAVVAFETTDRHSEWSENLGIIRKCIDSVVDKILTPTLKDMHIGSTTSLPLRIGGQKTLQT
ncbi:BTB/POZ domain-containing protein isoform X1 [Tanacetum coccineum]|uniref:BTB/POZ domain-containing protein isoform X1 n=1 Tax=Tanacetum coccineum TaxID=301880 RepID=A0ABQ5FA53_9ASTR